jgi:hypothetical protein
MADLADVPYFFVIFVLFQPAPELVGVFVLGQQIHEDCVEAVEDCFDLILFQVLDEFGCESVVEFDEVGDRCEVGFVSFLPHLFALVNTPELGVFRLNELFLFLNAREEILLLLIFHKIYTFNLMPGSEVICSQGIIRHWGQGERLILCGSVGGVGGGD